ncbi:kinase-like domain-containing protein [Xylaria grammica]|nr:kinase-like domain-containing protein [Xylaria grammica]
MQFLFLIPIPYPDLIARVYPLDDSDLGHAQKAIKGSLRCMPPRCPEQVPPGTRQSRGAREPTEPLEDPQLNPDTLPYIELRFSNGPSTSSGFIFGKDPDVCDITLSPMMSISRRHFALTYKNTFDDGRYRLIVRDLGSTHGTIVTYDKQGRSQRRKFDWIIDGFKAPQDVRDCIIEPHEKLKFKIVVAHHEITSQAYIGNVERFLQGAAPAEDLLGGLSLQSAVETERHSRLHSPSTHPILLSLGQIARGGFGVVTRQWDVSTGKEYVYKAPILGSTQNDHIVRLRFWVNPPNPLLCLEYMPYGNLEDQHGMAPFTYNESLVIFHQSLLALEYLHGQLVTNRDLKPENILVQCRGTDRNPRCLHVKLSDFGLSGVGSLYTICGSKTYWPPEIVFDASPQKYTNAVDIWSLGVVLLRLAYSLPDPGSGIGMEWC